MRQFYVRVPREVHEHIAALATREGRSLQHMVRVILAAYVETERTHALHATSSLRIARRGIDTVARL